MSKFVTFTTQNEHGSWLIKQGVKIEDIKKVVSVPDKYITERDVIIPC